MVADQQKLMNHIEADARAFAARRRQSTPLGPTITNNNFPDAIFVHDSVSHRIIKLHVLLNLNLSHEIVMLP